jgi:hypothetical protein
MTNGLVLATGYEALDWLPSIKGRDGLDDLVGIVMGAEGIKAKVQGPKLGVLNPVKPF